MHDRAPLKKKKKLGTSHANVHTTERVWVEAAVGRVSGRKCCSRGETGGDKESRFYHLRKKNHKGKGKRKM